MAALKYLDHSHSQLNRSILESFWNIAALTHLDLSFSQINGSIPEAFGNMVPLNMLNSLTVNLMVSF